MLSEVEAKFGAPRELSLQYEINEDDLALVRGSRKNDRSHDITLFIFYPSIEDTLPGAGLGNRYIVVIRKPGFPPGGYRAPSGGASPGESLEAGAKREACEETGLDIELEHYLLRVNAVFTCGSAVEKWVTHVFQARVVGGYLDPIDTEEIEHAKCVTIDELQGPIRQVLLSSGRALFAYRIALTDATVEMLRSRANK
jgi:8-oxo-dGTP pyrophosphatase MutT (NUDIX family)